MLVKIILRDNGHPNLNLYKDLTSMFCCDLVGVVYSISWMLSINDKTHLEVLGLIYFVSLVILLIFVSFHYVLLQFFVS